MTEIEVLRMLREIVGNATTTTYDDSYSRIDNIDAMQMLNEIDSRIDACQKTYERVKSRELVCEGMEYRLAGSDDDWRPVAESAAYKPASVYPHYEFRKPV